jgi:hypothetical protein
MTEEPTVVQMIELIGTMALCVVVIVGVLIWEIETEITKTRQAIEALVEIMKRRT